MRSWGCVKVRDRCRCSCVQRSSCVVLAGLSSVDAKNSGLQFLGGHGAKCVGGSPSGVSRLESVARKRWRCVEKRERLATIHRIGSPLSLGCGKGVQCGRRDSHASWSSAAFYKKRFTHDFSNKNNKFGRAGPCDGMLHVGSCKCGDGMGGCRPQLATCFSMTHQLPEVEKSLS